MFKRFEEIAAWQEARALSKFVHLYSKRAIAEKDFGWSKQIGESVLSIMANIAEGNDATTNAEFITFLGYAKRSCAETASHMYCGLDRGYVLSDEFSRAYASTRKIGAMLASLMTYLRSSQQNTVRIHSNL